MSPLFGAKTPAIRGPKAISVLESLQLGGVKQWVVIRGRDTGNPLLVYLHGGPGGSDYGAMRKWCPELEDHYTVVHWIQRGANKSYSPTIPPESMTVEQFLSDLHELILHVTARFGKKKVVLVGQSIGTALGVLYAQRHPKRVHAWVGVNQVVDRASEEVRAHELTLAAARERGNAKAVADLERLGLPVNGVYAVGVGGTGTQRLWMSKLGLVSHDPARLGVWQRTMAFVPELTWPERFRLLKGLMWSMERLWPEYGKLNLLESVPELQVPVYLMGGRHDKITNLDLMKAFLDQLKAPRKELVVGENAGHISLFEEPELFSELMIKTVRPTVAE